MDTLTVVAIVVVAVVVLGAVLIALWASQRKRSEELRGTFGSEYDRTVGEYGDKRDAERALRERRERVERLRITPLSYDDVQKFDGQWRQVQTRFVDDPKGAIKEADDLVGKVMEKRGYPVGDFEQRAADVSVDHASVVTNYRAAHQVSLESDRGQATTEEMRQAMQHYRALFDDLLQTAEARR